MTAGRGDPTHAGDPGAQTTRPRAEGQNLDHVKREGGRAPAMGAPIPTVHRTVGTRDRPVGRDADTSVRIQAKKTGIGNVNRLDPPPPMCPR
jgi:hypothetical protein